VVITEKYFDGYTIDACVNEQGFTLTLGGTDADGQDVKHFFMFSNGYLSKLASTASMLVEYHEDHAAELRKTLKGGE
jgi:hypothetical protein